MSTKISTVRVGAATMLAAVGLHPIRHYAADVLHPIYSITHPIRSIIP